MMSTINNPQKSRFPYTISLVFSLMDTMRSIRGKMKKARNPFVVSKAQEIDDALVGLVFTCESDLQSFSLDSLVDDVTSLEEVVDGLIESYFS